MRISYLLLSMFQDLKYGVRSLARNPGFSIVVIITLAIGIGANTAIFSFVDGILLRPLPYPEQERLAVMWEINSGNRGSVNGASILDYLDWRSRNRVFEDIGAWFGGYFSLTGNDGEPEEIDGMHVSKGLFEILRVSPALGRTFTAEEHQPGRDDVVILSQGLWKRRFGSDQKIIGRKIIVNSTARTVIGVMPAGFRFPDTRELWIPVVEDPKAETRGFRHFGIIARLKPGITLEQAQANMTVIAHQLENENPATNKGMGVRVTSMRSELTGDYRESLVILLGAVICVLLVACANVANIVLARVIGRRKELAVRSALGASRWRIIQQMLVESLLLGAIGGLLGLAMGFGIQVVVGSNSH